MRASLLCRCRRRHRGGHLRQSLQADRLELATVTEGDNLLQLHRLQLLHRLLLLHLLSR